MRQPLKKRGFLVEKRQVNSRLMLVETGTRRQPVLESSSGLFTPEWKLFKDVSILKFGGSSLQSAEGIMRVASVIDTHRKNGDTAVVVVSAMKGVTDSLVELAQKVEDNQRNRAEELLCGLAYRHMRTVESLGLTFVRKTILRGDIQYLFTQLDGLVYSSESFTSQRRDEIWSFGERLSAQMVAACCNNGVAVDASRVIVTDDNFGKAQPDLDLTQRRTEQIISPILQLGATPVITGFFGATSDGRITILGRNCSDKSAAVLALVMGAEGLILYKDEDGIYDSDPKLNHGAGLLDTVSFDEYFNIPGAQKAVHPDTVKLLRDSDTEIWVRSTFNPERKGTRLLRSSQSGRERL